MGKTAQIAVKWVHDRDREAVFRNLTGQRERPVDALWYNLHLLKAGLTSFHLFLTKPELISLVKRIKQG